MTDPIGSWFTTDVESRPGESVVWSGRATRIDLRSEINDSSFGGLFVTTERLIFAVNLFGFDKRPTRIDLDRIESVDLQERFAGDLTDLIARRGYRRKLQIETDDGAWIFVTPDVDTLAQTVCEAIGE